MLQLWDCAPGSLAPSVEEMQAGGGDPSSPPLRHRAWELGNKVQGAAHHSYWVPVPELGPGALSVALRRCLEHPVCMVTGILEAPPEAGRLPYQDLHLNLKVA